MTPVILTRRALYDLVWSKPLRDVAADLGISDVGLAKVCARHRVPRPEQGYWNKIHAGKPAKRSVFVDVDDVHLNRVEINGALTQLPETVRVQIENSRAKRKAAAASIGPRLQAPPVTDPPKELHKAIELTARTLMWLHRGRCYLECGHIRIPREFARPGKSYYGKRRTESASRVTLDFALSERLSACVPNAVSEIRATFPRDRSESKLSLST